MGRREIRIRGRWKRQGREYHRRLALGKP